VNTIERATAVHLQRFFDGLATAPFSASQPCSTTKGRLQGLDANIKQYQNSPLMCESVPDGFKPVLFRDGVRYPFPKPTVSELKKLRLTRKTKLGASTRARPRLLRGESGGGAASDRS